MSRPARQIAILLAWFVVTWPPAARAQTIGDYSRAQRAWLESTMSQAAARSAGVAASSSGSATGVAVPSSGASPASPPRVAVPMRVGTPAVQVNGVFKASASTVAEVVVNATTYLLESGEYVPGTPWQVESVAVDRVVLGRRGASGGVDVEAARKVFALPAMR